MRCPECGKEMKDKSFSYQSIADWEGETYSYEERFTCPNCKIHFRNGNWNIPEKYLPTEKQVKCVLVICSVLGIKKPILTKKSAWEFINKHMDESKQQQEINKARYYEELAGWGWW